MPDWNNDGKQDWHDDFVINEIIPDKKSAHNTANRHSHVSNSGCTIAVVIGIAILWGIFNILASIKY